MRLLMVSKRSGLAKNVANILQRHVQQRTAQLYKNLKAVAKRVTYDYQFGMGQLKHLHKLL